LRNHWFGNSTLLQTKVLGAALTPGSSVIKHLKQDQYLEMYRSKCKQHFSTDISSSGVIFKDVLPGINSLSQ
jgi:hypothetical protein